MGQQGDTALRIVKCLAESPAQVAIVKLARRGFDPTLTPYAIRHFCDIDKIGLTDTINNHFFMKGESYARWFSV
jgi:hypothetical protein